MDFLKKLLSSGKSQPRQQPTQGQAQVPYSQATADRYNANPQSPEFSGRNAVDPKYFGYPADNGPQLQVQPNYGMQGFGRGQEDDYSPYDALTGRAYNNQQTTLHSGIQQGGMNRQADPQQQNDLLRKLLGY